MPPRALEGAIARLYQRPREESARAGNSPGGGGGAEAAGIRALPKPPLAAWAINHLYWRKVAVWNALVAAAEHARGAHRALLAGRAGDVRPAGKLHDEAADVALKTPTPPPADAHPPPTRLT